MQQGVLLKLPVLSIIRVRVKAGVDRVQGERGLSVKEAKCNSSKQAKGRWAGTHTDDISQQARIYSLSTKCEILHVLERGPHW